MLQELIFKEIDQRRNLIQMSKAQVAYRAGISYNQYLNIEHGMNTSLSTMEKLLKAVGVKSLNIVM